MEDLWGQAKQLVLNKQYEDAIPILEELRMTADTEHFRMDILERLAVCHTNVGNLDQAEELLHTVSELAILTHDHPQLIRTRLSLSFVAILRREYQVALYHVCRAYATYEQLKDKAEDLHTKILLQSATISYYQGRTDITIEILKDVLQHHRHFLEPDMERRIELRLTVLQVTEENWQESVQNLLGYAAEYERQKDRASTGEVHAELSEIYTRFEKGEQSNFHANLALNLLPDVHPASGKAHRVLASMALHQDQDAWQEHMQQAIHVFLKLGLFWELDDVLLTLSQSLAEQGKWEEAYRLLDEWKDHTLGLLQERGIVL
jgi:tetratricopeptide (TPR) repeat protein